MGEPELIRTTIEKLKLPQGIKGINLPKGNMVVKSKPKCEYCGDFGSVYPIRDGVVIYSEFLRCSCRKKESEEKRRLLLLKNCHLPPFAGLMTFKNFEVYPAVKTAHRVAVDIAEKPDEIAWLAFLGENGNGKTHLAIAICKAWIRAGIPAHYVLTSLLLEELRQGYQIEKGEYSYDNRFRYYCNVPLLLLDDYGIESRTPWVQEKLDTIIDYRLMNNLSLILTSNSTLDEMPEKIKSRLIRHPDSQIVAIIAEDYKLRGNK